MRFMIIVKATADTERGAMPGERMMAEMAAFHEELARAGALLDASGLQPTGLGWRIRYEQGRRSVVQGPFGGAAEPMAGYTLIQARSREEALEWSKRCPCPYGEGASGEIEVRQLFELDDFPPNDAVARFRKLEAVRG